MNNSYYSVNIRRYINRGDISGMQALTEAISSFTCPRNPDIEHFLKHSAIDFTRKQQSVTYLAFTKESTSFVGYFSLTVKPLVIGVKDIPSNTVRRKIERVARFDEKTQSYSAAGYLINSPREELIQFYRTV